MHNPNTKNITTIITAVIFSSFASLGTIPYGYHFADFLQAYSHTAFLIFGVCCAICAGLANIALGTYSLLSLDMKQKIIPVLPLFALSLMSAIPTGILSYFGYHTVLPLLANVVIMIAVIFTNAGIYNTAIFNLVQEIVSTFKRKESVGKLTLRIVGFFLGMLVSLSFYMAVINGLASLFSLYFAKTAAFQSACVLGFIIWLPGAALFGNSTQVCIAQFYDALSNLSQTIKKMTKLKIFIFIFCVFAASAYTQIAIVFFNPAMDIPNFFKLPEIQIIIYRYLVPMAFFSAFSVNYLALVSLLKVK